MSKGSAWITYIMNLRPAWATKDHSPHQKSKEQPKSQDTQSAGIELGDSALSLPITTHTKYQT